MNLLHKLLIKYFSKRHIVKEAHADRNGIDAAFPARFGNAPLKIRYEEDGRIFSRCYSPIRIPDGQMKRVQELVHRLNNILPDPKLGIDYQRRLAYGSAAIDPNSYLTNNQAIQILVNDCMNLTHLLFGSMTKVLYGGETPKETVESLCEAVHKKSQEKKEDNNSHNRIKDLM